MTIVKAEVARLNPFTAACQQPAISLQEQADFYQPAFEVLWGKLWLKGIFWYQYYVCTPEWLESPQDRPAEEVIKKYYLER